MAVFHDTEFGPVTIRRSKLSRQVKLSVAPNGSLRVSMPLYAPLFLAKRLVNASRADIRALLSKQATAQLYLADGPIGKSHSLTVQPGAAFSVHVADRHLMVTSPDEKQLLLPVHQTQIRDAVATDKHCQCCSQPAVRPSMPRPTLSDRCSASSSPHPSRSVNDSAVRSSPR